MVQQFQLPQLPYSLDALEPVISAEIMSLHYNKHHQAYVTNLNKALQQYEEASKNNDIAAMIALQSAIKFNGGGHINHSIFWTNLAPKQNGGGQLPQGDIAGAINDSFGSLDKLIETMSAKAVAVQGSGWAWLTFNPSTGRLEVITCDNQDPVSIKGLVPLLGIDVWEHAYYLQYKNVRADYVKAIWSIVNWKNVSERYAAVGSKGRMAAAGR
jgi:Fe-Mn family superoxide dismutase